MKMGANKRNKNSPGGTTPSLYKQDHSRLNRSISAAFLIYSAKIVQRKPSRSVTYSVTYFYFLFW